MKIFYFLIKINKYYFYLINNSLKYIKEYFYFIYYLNNYLNEIIQILE
jgi:hypothetical protein